ncbi:uncharacterized protein LDX57_004841 [Aspergillus melleus]|uniref:uncharacterized protein n=1 Tax=Aspergillus melleus TaxID=138277 RepID=UPI001E8E1AD5|nr:uncharacterized protein LDX57_004841 [Aspergillus melleus]KAH8427124.1 hypothetical protein LDX57_004841 [Aspergillus melleus]
MLPPPAASNDVLPCQILAEGLGFDNRDHELWWLNTAESLNRVMIQCDYSVDMQYKYLSFFHRQVLPRMGTFRRPGVEPDFICGLSHGGHPFEISVKMDNTATTCRVGFSPIGPFAGTKHDPLNSHSNREMLAQLTTMLPQIDLRWFDHFHGQFALDQDQQNAVTGKLIRESHGVESLSIDFKNNDMVPKAYFYPIPAHIGSGTSLFDLGFRALESLEATREDAGLKSAVAVFKDFLKSRVPAEGTMNGSLLGMVGIDCLHPSESRLKLYLANFRMDLATIREYWTIGGVMSDETTTKGLELAETLAKRLNLGDKACDTIDPERLPFMLNYEVRPGSSAIKPQIYFPLLGVNDEFIADALMDFFQVLGWTHSASHYKEELRQRFPRQDLSQTTNVQRWLGFSYSAQKGPTVNIYYDAVAGNVAKA